MKKRGQALWRPGRFILEQSLDFKQLSCPQKVLQIMLGHKHLTSVDEPRAVEHARNFVVNKNHATSPNDIFEIVVSDILQNDDGMGMLIGA